MSQKENTYIDCEDINKDCEGLTTQEQLKWLKKAVIRLQKEKNELLDDIESLKKQIRK